MKETPNLVAKLTPEQEARKRFQLDCFSPDDAKYGDSGLKLVPHLSQGAEWHGCVHLQEVLLETRVEMGLAPHEAIDKFLEVKDRLDALNISLLEGHKSIRHDQLAVLAEIGRFAPDIVALLHPGTTSYDILDSARAYLLKRAWYGVIRAEAASTVLELSDLSVRSKGILQVGRTHLQDTSPVPFETTLALYAARLASRIEKSDAAFDDLRGKVSGIVGTGASIDMVIGEGMSIEFEKRVLEKVGLTPDYTATQITQKERLADVGNAVALTAIVLGDFANDVRLLYSSAIKEVGAMDNAARLGGSSADAMKDNPIDWENIAGKVSVVKSGMGVLYDLVPSDLQRDLRGSVISRYQPQLMMVEVYEMFQRANKALKQFTIIEDRVETNLQSVRRNPSEAMVAILRGAGWEHPTYGVGHDFVKEMGKQAKAKGLPLLTVARADAHFEELFTHLPDNQQVILQGELELYTGSAIERAALNREYATGVALMHQDRILSKRGERL